MSPPSARFFFDYTDPLSYLLEREIQAEEEASGARVKRVPLELCPPPSDLLDPESSAWAQRVTAADAAAVALGLRLRAQPLIPWTRKAHELVCHAKTHDMGEAVHRAILDGVFTAGLDVGRVDVLVDLAVGLGLDATETKAVLDVDRYSDDIAGMRAAALAEGITQVPTVVAGENRLEGFHNRHALSTLLHASRSPDNTTD